MQKSGETLVAGVNGHLPDLNMTASTIVVLCVAICVKLVLWYICSRIAKNSPSADALAQVFIYYLFCFTTVWRLLTCLTSY